MSQRIAVALGSNLGDRAAHLAAAVDGLAERVGTVVGTSSIYETAPVGGPEQGPYLNAVVLVDTELSAKAVLARLLEIERSRDRERTGDRWGPRTLDLDLLLYGDQVIDRSGLTVPHPEMHRRRFVLEPLHEVWPDATIPGIGPVSDALRTVADQDVAEWGGESTVSPRLAAAVLFFTVGLSAVAIWFLIDLVIG